MLQLLYLVVGIPLKVVIILMGRMVVNLFRTVKHLDSNYLLVGILSSSKQKVISNIVILKVRA